MNFIKINVKVYLVIIKLKLNNIGLLECWDQKWVTLGAVIYSFIQQIFTTTNVVPVECLLFFRHQVQMW